MDERQNREREESFLKLLKSLQVAGQHGTSTLGVVGRIAAWIDSPRVLHGICRHPDWFGSWQIKEALLRNPFTPAGPRTVLERQIAVFDLLRELDSQGLSPEEQQEIKEDVKGLLSTLSEADRGAVKVRALELSSSRGRPRLEPEEESPEELEAGALEAGNLEFDGFDGRIAEQEEPVVPEPEALPEPTFTLPEPEYQDIGTGEYVLEDLLASAADVVLDSDLPPADLPRIDDSQTEGPVLAPPEVPRTELPELPEPTFEVFEMEPEPVEATEVAKPIEDPAPQSAEVQPTPVEVSEVSEVSEVAAEPVSESAPEVSVRSEPELAAESAPGAEPERADEAVLPAEPALDAAALRQRLAQDLETARTSSDVAVLSSLATRPVEELQIALLENFALPELAAVSLARRASANVASCIYRSKRWFNRPRIREALLDCPSAPAAAQLAALGSLRDFGKILTVLTSPRIRHLEVKAKARARLRGLFQTLSQGEKLAAVRSGGRRLLQQLWTDFFRDEPLVLRCLREKRLDEGTVLEIARSKIAPRRALEEIGKTAAWTASYPIRLALVMNPKTPRPIAARLLQRLKPADRKMIKKNMAISVALRNQA